MSSGGPDATFANWSLGLSFVFIEFTLLLIGFAALLNIMPVPATCAISIQLIAFALYALLWCAMRMLRRTECSSAARTWTNYFALAAVVHLTFCFVWALWFAQYGELWPVDFSHNSAVFAAQRDLIELQITSTLMLGVLIFLLKMK
jgi:hypothetical protein